MREALAVSRAIYGAPHPSVATMLGNLATFERSAGQLDAAERDQREGLQIVRSVLGDAHYLVGVAHVGLASTQIEQGRSDQALISYREGLRILDGSLGRAHADDAQARAAYADLLLQLGQRDAARDEASATLAAIGDSLAQGNPKRARIALVSLRIDAASGDCVTPLASLTATIEALQKGGNALRFDLASAWLLQARCLKQGQRLDQAASARATAEALLQQMPYVPRRLRAERAAAG
jgi:tetratricopeptide (TPR) repeat protein